MHIRNCFKHTLVAMIILLSSFSFLGCKKAAEEAPAFYTPEVPIISTMKTWITDQKQYVSMSVQMRIDSLLATADWQKAMQTNVANGKSILYVPIRSSELGLEFFYDNKTKGIDSGNLVKVETKNSTLANTEIVAAKTYYETVILGKASTNPFTGTIHTYNIAANFIYDYKFDGGKIISHAIVAPIHHSQTLKKANGLKANAVVCEEWGMYLIWEYSPPTLVYTFLVCSGMPDCPPTSSLAISIGGGKQYVGVNCAAPPSNSGGATGGGSTNNDQAACDAAIAAAQQFENESEFVETNETVSVTVISTQNPYKKYKNIAWKCLNGTVRTSMYVLSNEEGIVKYVPTFPDDPSFEMRWEWESLIHKKATLIGGNLLTGTISLIAESGTPSFVAPGFNKLWASMDLSLTLNFQPLAITLPIPNCSIPLTMGYQKSYNRSGIWDAKP